MKIYLKILQINQLIKNLVDANNKLRKSIDCYDIVMNRRSLTERNKGNNYKIKKKFCSLGKITINNLVTDLGICQNHIKDKLNVIAELLTKKEI